MPTEMVRRRGTRGGTMGLGLLLGASVLVTGACSDLESSTDLNPEGPPRVLQVFAQERIFTASSSRESFQIAFGDHPEIPLPEDDPVRGDDRQVTNAVAWGTSHFRVIFDEIIPGNYFEEIECFDGTYSRVPLGADPDDIADCAGPSASLTNCRAVCLAPAGSPAGTPPIGVKDENEDGAADGSRMIDYGGELAIKLTCGGVNIPLSPELSYYNPSGNQQLPRLGNEYFIDGLGPALFVQPLRGLRTGSECTFSFRPEVLDKDGNQICASAGGDPDAPCTPGDTQAITFTSEPLAVKASLPTNGGMNVPLISAGETTDAVIFITFFAGIDEDSLAGAITLNDGTTDVAVTATASADDPTLVSVRVAGGYTASTSYTLTIGTGVSDLFGGTLPNPVTISFTTAAP